MWRGDPIGVEFLSLFFYHLHTRWLIRTHCTLRASHVSVLTRSPSTRPQGTSAPRRSVRAPRQHARLPTHGRRGARARTMAVRRGLFDGGRRARGQPSCVPALVRGARQDAPGPFPHGLELTFVDSPLDICSCRRSHVRRCRTSSRY